MFEKIRYRLLLSYLVVIASILGTFAIAVRTVFTRSLTHQLTDKLIALGQGAAANAEYENGQIKIESDFPVQDLIANNQALEWFDTQRRLVERQGKATVTLPLSPKETVQFQTRKNRLIATTLPIIGSDDRKLIGYVRVSQSLEEYDETLSKLDWGLGGGILVALALSGIGGVWLTRQAMQPIEQSFQRLKQFTADASHELRSPLMAVKSNATVALKYPEGMRETDKEKFQAIASATNQMSRLTEDLLFLARNDKIPHRNRDIIDLTELLENLVQLYKPQAEAKQIKLSIQVTKNLRLLGDSDQLRRLFGNLIENAIHYTPNSGTVEIKDRRISPHWYIEVRDTGVGIAPEQLKHVFDRFWRADRSRSYNSGGSGLGLAIAQAIAQNHGGLITVTSQVEVGSCFTVRLPTNATSVL
ncbi:HAMP domain-containing sensor histidine kinase [Chroococcidiopsis thermalis]|uniref:histidine kinase n=1 Tax=Chroococcidiopsis thermalis (strain PCC 7203) TaxID=251229 RepID=K9U953_CHRTP|nr:HAMP domain-containing sensor histidine kinase [Chroococcidiopsis thermalis]AFY90981.1 histidine kinase [Chroococcidiopsis thermalis PCC 7203]